MGLENYNYKVGELQRAVDVPHRMSSCKAGQRSGISIGRSLEYLNKLGKTGQEFDGDCDGIDALCYHLDRFTCEGAIETLQAILERFKTLDAE